MPAPRTAFLLLAVAANACGGGPAREGSGAQEPVVGLPCEGCEAVFVGLPAELGWSGRIAPASEPGEPLRLEGTVRDADGRPVEGVILYAYHTDRHGVYPEARASRGTEAEGHGRLRGWVRTDAEGSYRFETIRPASYPGNDPPPQHVHLHVLEPGRCTYWAESYWFDDDPRLTEAIRRSSATGRCGDGVVRPEPDGRGGRVATRDLTLGAGVPGYPERLR